MNLSYDNLTLVNFYFRLPQFVRELMAGAYSLKIRNKRYGGYFNEQMEILKKNASLSFKEREQLQFQTLKDTLNYAMENVPYYQNLFKKIGFIPDDMRSLDDLRRIPVLEREVIRNRADELLSKSYTGSTYIHHTSGTTGMALSFTLSTECNQRSYACMWYQYSWGGVKRGDPIATFGYHPVTSSEKKTPPFWLHDPVENELFFSIQHISAENAHFYIEELNRFRPVMIRGVPSFINLIAQYMLESGMSYRPNAIFTNSETLTDFQRKNIEKAFGCTVFNYYSNGERTCHVLQCEKGSLHVLTETGVVEVLRPNGTPAAAGEVGDLVLTNMINRAMPLIRYKIGDTAVMGEGSCPCGRQTPLLKELTGRITDHLVTKDGRRIHPIHVFCGTTEKVLEAQFVQEKVGSAILKIVPRQDFTKEDEKALMDEVIWDIGKDIDIELQIVKEIERTKTGKFRHIVSKLGQV